MYQRMRVSGNKLSLLCDIRAATLEANGSVAEVKKFEAEFVLYPSIGLASENKFTFEVLASIWPVDGTISYK